VASGGGVQRRGGCGSGCGPGIVFGSGVLISSLSIVGAPVRFG
jgi:hypothetical protein